MKRQAAKVEITAPMLVATARPWMPSILAPTNGRMIWKGAMRRDSRNKSLAERMARMPTR